MHLQQPYTFHKNAFKSRDPNPTITMVIDGKVVHERAEGSVALKGSKQGISRVLFRNTVCQGLRTLSLLYFIVIILVLITFHQGQNGKNPHNLTRFKVSFRNNFFFF